LCPIEFSYHELPGKIFCRLISNEKLLVIEGNAYPV
jgi:hypothetical protein